MTQQITGERRYQSGAPSSEAAARWTRTVNSSIRTELPFTTDVLESSPSGTSTARRAPRSHRCEVPTVVVPPPPPPIDPYRTNGYWARAIAGIPLGIVTVGTAVGAGVVTWACGLALCWVPPPINPVMRDAIDVTRYKDEYLTIFLRYLGHSFAIGYECGTWVADKVLFIPNWFITGIAGFIGDCFDESPDITWRDTRDPKDPTKLVQRNTGDVVWQCAMS